MRREALLLLWLAGPAWAQEDAPAEDAPAADAPAAESAPVAPAADTPAAGAAPVAPAEAPSTPAESAPTPPEAPSIPAESAPTPPEAPESETTEAAAVPVADEAPFVADWRLALRGGASFVLDDAFDAVADGPTTGGGEVGVDYRLSDSIWVGASWSGRGRAGDVFDDVQTSWSGVSLRASVAWRHDLLPWLDVFGRAGPSVWWYDLELTPAGGSQAHVEASTWGAHAGLGVDVYFLHPSFTDDALEGLALGLSVEATWDQVLAIDVADGGTDFGDIDPSGPGFLFGFALAF